MLVADIGGGTSDFSLVRVGPERRTRAERRDDILANHGVHAAGTDFDRHIELACILPHLRPQEPGPGHARARRRARCPARVYFDLATWHLINTVYVPQRVSELARMRDFYGDTRMHERLMRVVTQRLGHALAALAEQAKIDVADSGQTHLALDAIEAGLAVDADARPGDRRRSRAIWSASSPRRAKRCARPAWPTTPCDALYLTGGSTGPVAAGATPGGGVPVGAAGSRRPLRQRGPGAGAACTARLRADATPACALVSGLQGRPAQS